MSLIIILLLIAGITIFLFVARKRDSNWSNRRGISNTGQDDNWNALNHPGLFNGHHHHTHANHIDTTSTHDSSVVAHGHAASTEFSGGDSSGVTASENYDSGGSFDSTTNYDSGGGSESTTATSYDTGSSSSTDFGGGSDYGGGGGGGSWSE